MSETLSSREKMRLATARRSENSRRTQSVEAVKMEAVWDPTMLAARTPTDHAVRGGEGGVRTRRR